MASSNNRQQEQSLIVVLEKQYNDAATATLSTSLITLTTEAVVEVVVEEISPSILIKSILPNRKIIRPTYDSFRSYPYNVAMEKNYTNDVVNAIRNNDITTLRELHESGHSFSASNRTGETLLHLACRRSNIETIQFLINEANVPIDVTDSMGRTILHDVCWRSNIDIIIFDMIIKLVTPDMIVAEDIRGHSCFDFCRQEHWNIMNTYLNEHHDMIVSRAQLYDNVIR